MSEVDKLIDYVRVELPEKQKALFADKVKKFMYGICECKITPVNGGTALVNIDDGTVIEFVDRYSRLRGFEPFMFRVVSFKGIEIAGHYVSIPVDCQKRTIAAELARLSDEH